MNNELWSREPFQTWTSIHELSEIKKDRYKTYMVTYQLGNLIKTGVHQGSSSFRSGSLPFF